VTAEQIIAPSWLVKLKIWLLDHSGPVCGESTNPDSQVGGLVRPVKVMRRPRGTATPSRVTLGVLYAIRIGNSRMKSKIGLKIPRGV
jgi:hypothetical protein